MERVVGEDMICILAGNQEEASTWARSQLLANNEWFYPEDEEDLRNRTNFHVVVVGSAGYNVPPSYFNRIYAVAQRQGRIDRT